MNGAVFAEVLRRHWRQAVYWGLGIGFIAFVQIAALPSTDALTQMTELLATMPPVFLQMFGMSDLSYIATPEGYLAARTFGFMMLLLSAYGVVVGLNVTANDEERGIMDSVLSLPVTRARLVLEKLLAYTVLSVLVIAIVFALTLFGILVTPTMSVDVGRIAAATVNGLPGLLVVLAFTTLMGALARRRGLATALATAFVIGSYFIDTLGRDASTSILNTLRAFSFHAYYDGTGVMRDGLRLENMLLLVTVAVVLAGLSMVAYQRRDIGV